MRLKRDYRIYRFEMNIKERKQMLRSRMLRKRSLLDREYRLRIDNDICEKAMETAGYKNAETVFCYVSTEYEVNTLPIIKRTLKEGKRLGIPRCEGKGTMNVYEIEKLEDLEPGTFGIMEPAKGCRLIPKNEIDIAFVPCLTCDKRGTRLGYGGGFYDRYLKNTDFTKFVLCREIQLSKSVPAEENDHSMDYIITERGEIKMKDKKLIGTFFETASSAVIECLGRTGLDFVIIDTEHGYFTEDTVVDYIRSAENVGILPYVRIGDIRRPYILRMADIGARGLIVPNIKTPEQVKEVVSYAKFAPVGDRGFCPTRISGWGADDWAQDNGEYMAECNRRLKVIPQCETKEAFENIEEIAAIKGVDGIFIGPCDLSISLGVPLQFDSPVLLDAIEKILAVCKKYGKESYIFCGDTQTADTRLKQGFDAVACGLDTSVITAAYKQITDILR